MSPRTVPLVLVVDDVTDTRDMYAAYLTHHGFRVIEAPDGASAIRLALEQQPDGILMDMGMPGLDGWEATRRLKADATTRHIPVLGISAHAFHDSVERARTAGVDDFCIKPCLPATALARLRALMRR